MSRQANNSLSLSDSILASEPAMRAYGCVLRFFLYFKIPFVTSTALPLTEFDLLLIWDY